MTLIKWMIPSGAVYNPIEDIGGDNLLAINPESLLSNLSKQQPGMLHYTCPAFIETFKHTYIIRSYFDVSIKVDPLKRSIEVDKDKSFIQKYITNRNQDCSPDGNMIFSLNQELLFITDNDVEIETLPCYYHNNDFVDKTMFISGRFNIKKWIRSIEAAVIVKKTASSTEPIFINIKRGDPIYYVRFHLKDNSKLNLVQECDFNKIEEYIKYILITNGVKRIKPYTKLTELYEMFSRFRPKKFFNKCPFGFK